MPRLFYRLLVKLKLQKSLGRLATSFKPKIVANVQQEQISFAEYFSRIMYNQDAATPVTDQNHDLQFDFEDIDYAFRKLARNKAKGNDQL